MIDNSSDGDEIWVAAGTYRPENRLLSSSDVAFILKKNVKIYGGFAGNETTLIQRNVINNPTILDGYYPALIFNGQVILPAVNAHHVVISVGDVGDACLNGFTIQRGRANGSGSITVNGYNVTRGEGGGIYLANNSFPELKYLTVINNESIGNGGGIYINNTASNSLKITNVIVRNNNSIGNSSGGGIYCKTPISVLTNVEVSNNFAFNNGGGIYFNSDFILTNVTIAGNDAMYGGGIYRVGNSYSIRNSIITGNTAIDITNPDAYNIINNNCYYSLVGGVTSSTVNFNHDENADPKFVDKNNGNYRLQWSSPCIQMGSMSYWGYTINSPVLVTPDAVDLDGNFRFFCYPIQPGIYFNLIDMGAYQYESLPPVFSPPIQKNTDNRRAINDQFLKESELELSIFPNPANDRITILSEDIAVQKVELYNLQGQLIKNVQLNDNTMDISSLSAGMYSLRIITEKGVAVKNIVKQ